MITVVKEKRVITEKEVNAEFDGKWVLLNEQNFSPSENKGYLVAYGDGISQDRDALKQLNWDKYDGRAFLLKGHTCREDIIYGIYEC
jgi:hypothetical protein